MNRTLLLIIADFLLLSLLALARFDPVPETIEAEDAYSKSSEEASKDLIEVLQMSLEAERKSRQDLVQAMDDLETDFAQKSVDFNKQSQELEAVKEQAKALELTSEALRNDLSEHIKVETAYKETQEKLESVLDEKAEVKRRLVEAEGLVSNASVRAEYMQKTLLERERAIQAAEAKLEKMESEQRLMELEKQTLATNLKVAEAEKHILNQNLKTAQIEIQGVKAEKAKMQEHASRLAQNVGSLAENTSLIHNEVKEMQPVSMNHVYERYQADRISLKMKVSKNGLLGEKNVEKIIESVAIASSSGNWVLFYAKDTPLYSNSVFAVNMSAQIGGHEYPLKSLSALKSHPHILGARVESDWLEASAIKPYDLSVEPTKFPRVVVVSSTGSYGEILIRQRPKRMDYFERVSKLFSNIPGAIKPNSGDLVFSKRGRFYGLMLSGELLHLVESLEMEDAIMLGSAFNSKEHQDWIQLDVLGVEQSRQKSRR